MDDRTRENWRRVKEALEAAGKTDCDFYRRAVAIERTGPRSADGPHRSRIPFEPQRQ